MAAVPEVKYAEGRDGLVAYQTVGTGPIDLLYLTGSASHIDVRWELPAAAAFLNRLASFSRLILFDRRGSGVSDGISLDTLPTWEEWADDITVVLDAVASERAAIFAVLDAGPMGMLFAATNPERASALILGNTAANYAGIEPHHTDAVIRQLRATWGTEEAAVISSPSFADDPTSRAWMAKYMRASATPRAAAEQQRAVLESDFRAVLPSIRVPTLVMNRERTGRGVDHGRSIAEQIPDARFVPLPGADTHFYSEGMELILDTVEEFLTGVRPQADPDRVLATILFTDVVDSTGLVARLGDAAWRRMLDRHDELARSEIERHRGRLVKTTGDGTVATFDAPGRAIRCALAFRDAIEPLGLEIRAGLHTGEVELRGKDIGGLGVHIAARVGALAGAGELLVSRTVVDLVAGSTITFTERGEHELKGVPGGWHLFAVES